MRDRAHANVGGRYDFTKTVVVASGDGLNTLTVHEKVLWSYSDFFKAACSPSWRKDGRRPIHRPRGTAAEFTAFKLYVAWLYSEQQPDLLKNARDLALDFAVESRYQQQYSHIDLSMILEFLARGCLLDAWILGDFLLDAEFKRKVIDAILHLGPVPSPMRAGRN
jgi:hypothetical protein